MNRRGFLKFFSVATVAAVVRPVMPFVASLVDKRDPFDSINSITLREISGARLADEIFRSSPLLEMLRSRQMQPFDGGREIQPSITGLTHFPPDGMPEDSAVGWNGNVFQSYGTISRMPPKERTIDIDPVVWRPD
jgi:hypothetical protein